MNNRRVLGERKNILQERKKYWPPVWHTYEVDGQEYNFRCQYYEVSGSNQASLWGHEVDFKIDYQTVSSAKCSYYNRTWETWEFQTCMLNALSNYMKSIENTIYDNGRQTYSLRNLSKDKKDKLLDESNEYKSLQKLYNMIANGDKGKVEESKTRKDIDKKLNETLYIDKSNDYIIKDEITSDLYEEINEQLMFSIVGKIMDKYGAQSGDITPEQSLRSDELVKELSELYATIVMQNMKEE